VPGHPGRTLVGKFDRREARAARSPLGLKAVKQGRAADREVPGHAIDIWVIDLVSDPEALLGISRRLGLAPAAETGTAAGSAGTTGQIDVTRTAARIALRALLAGYVGLDLARAPFISSRTGKPRLAAMPPGGTTVEFSLAHAEAAAIVAVSRSGPVGVDIEGSREIRITPKRRKMLVDAAAALAPFDALPDGPNEERFLQAWVRLEAIAKATGEGLGALLGRIDDSRGRLGETSIEGRSVHVRDVAVDAQLAVHAAVAGTAPVLEPANPSPVANSMPIDAAWIEHWITRPPDLSSGDNAVH
jgi:4'-phosphopantetheinyl transferase